MYTRKFEILQFNKCKTCLPTEINDIQWVIYCNKKIARAKKLLLKSKHANYLNYIIDYYKKERGY